MLLQVSPLPYGEEEEEAAEAWKEEKTWLSGLPLPSHHAASCILHRINIDQISCNPGLIDKANFR